MNTPTNNDTAQKTAEEINDIVNKFILENAGVRATLTASMENARQFLGIIRAYESAETEELKELLKEENALLKLAIETVKRYREALEKIRDCKRHVVNRRNPATWAQDIARAVLASGKLEGKEKNV